MKHADAHPEHDRDSCSDLYPINVDPTGSHGCARCTALALDAPPAQDVELRRDAERYRWLKEHFRTQMPCAYVEWVLPVEYFGPIEASVDGTIDAAIRAAEGEKPSALAPMPPIIGTCQTCYWKDEREGNRIYCRNLHQAHDRNWYCADWGNKP